MDRFIACCGMPTELAWLWLTDMTTESADLLLCDEESETKHLFGVVALMRLIVERNRMSSERRTTFFFVVICCALDGWIDGWMEWSGGEVHSTSLPQRILRPFHVYPRGCCF